MADLKNEVIRITNVELREKKRRDGTAWKEFEVKILNQPKGVYYTLPIKKADGSFTKVYEGYKSVKSQWEDMFISGMSVLQEVAVDEKKSDWKTKDGKPMTSTYKTIRMMREVDGTPEEETDISNIEF